MVHMNQCSALREVTWLISGRADPALRESPTSFIMIEKKKKSYSFILLQVDFYLWFYCLVDWLVSLN